MFDLQLLDRRGGGDSGAPRSSSLLVAMIAVSQPAGEANGRQEEDAAVRQGRHPAGGFIAALKVVS
jgi:hypothetical protein